MQQTSNYQLSQWDAEDRIQREDFNGDNAKIDAALHEAVQQLAEQATAIGKCGNCKIMLGTYTGNGAVGESNPTTLTFPDGVPLIIFIRSEERIGSNNPNMTLTYGCTWSATFDTDSQSVVFVNWSDNSVQWYSPASNTTYQLNVAGRVYRYVALFAADA